MRISDWSSDVGSSDLARADAGAGLRGAGGGRAAARRDGGGAGTGRAADRAPRAVAHPRILGARRAAGAGLGAGASRIRPRGGGGAVDDRRDGGVGARRSEAHTSELKSLKRIAYAGLCLHTKTCLLYHSSNYNWTH